MSRPFSGARVSTSQDEIFECLVPAGDLDEVTLGEMIRQPDVKSIIDLLATWRVPYAKPLTRRFPEYASERNLIVLESALDQYYYSNGLDAVRGDDYDQALVRDMLSTEIDVVNVKTVLRLIRDKIGPSDAGRYLIDGGCRLRRSFLLGMLEAKSLEEAVNMLKGARYGFLADVPEELRRRRSRVREAARRFLIAGAACLNRDPLSIAVAVGYWAGTTRSPTRIIARCKTADVPDETLRGAVHRIGSWSSPTRHVPDSGWPAWRPDAMPGRGRRKSCWPRSARRKALALSPSAKSCSTGWTRSSGIAWSGYGYRSSLPSPPG
jgi:V/A-type H+-transporting ATPase subunit C